MSLQAPGDAPSAGNDNEVSKLSELQVREKNPGISEACGDVYSKGDAGGSSKKLGQCP